MSASPPLRVLLVHDYGTLSGGAEHMAVGLRDGLRRRGHDARLLATTAASLPLPNEADYTCYGSTGPARRFIQVANPFAARTLRTVLSSFRPDVVHVRMFQGQLSPLILPVLRDVPSLLHVVNYDLICPVNRKVLPDGTPCRYRAGRACVEHGCTTHRSLARARLQRAAWDRWGGAFDLVVANSEWVRARLRAENVEVHETVWNGVPVTAERPPLSDPPVVAFAGRLEWKKGVHVLLEALARVVRELPQARLVVAGEGSERSALERRAAALGLAPSVDFLGHLPRPEAELALARAWVQVVPSLWEEPFGLVGAEAQMRGTAVVASDAGGVAEIVLDGETGLTVGRGDADALAGALLRVLRDRALAERWGAAARRHALASLGEERTVERFEALYRRLVPAAAASG